LSDSTLAIIGADAYVHGYPHAAWAELRRRPGLHWHDTEYAEPPFWAVTRRADLVAVSKRPDVFRNEPRLAVFPEIPGAPPPVEDRVLRHLLNMDPPDHARFRNVTSHRFTPRAVKSLEPAVDRITRDLVDGLPAGEDVEIDFVSRIAARMPLEVLADLLGVPRSDWELMFRWTNQAIGATDPEYQQGESPVETMHRAQLAAFQYFQAMVEERRKRPTDDLTSLVANGRIEDQPLPPRELLSYLFLLVIAGNETTRNATSGGLLALIENPDQLDRLRRDPTLLDSAVEEIVRFTSPVIQFCRTPVRDVEVAGTKVRAGESLCLFYPSANRDEAVFDAPDAFRVDRRPNPHVGFGIGEHFCLGANIARLELRLVFRHLVRRLEAVELVGPVERLRSSFVGGIKRMPVRLRLSV
jgi:cytochrome P450